MTIFLSKSRRHGALITDLIVAMALLAFAVFPIAASYVGEQKQFHVYSYRATAIEAVDGELELICALHSFPSNGMRSAHSPVSTGVTNLPAGRFMLERQQNLLRLTWTPQSPDHGGIVRKEILIP